MLQAFDLFKTKTASKIKFIIIGKKRWWSSNMQKIYNNLIYKKDIRFTGYVEEKKLNILISSAKCLCFVSLFEGFGLPIIEAMKCGTPVITSNTSSMPEICGKAGLIVNPKNIKEIALAMEKINEDPKLCDDLIKHGIERSKIFNWEKSADDFCEVLDQFIKK